MIARRSLGWMDMMAVAVRFRLLARVLGVGVIVMIAMDRVPDMLRPRPARLAEEGRSEEHTSELQSLMRISYAVFCLKKKNRIKNNTDNRNKRTTDIERI